jgi:hypothetical protein
VFECVFCLTRWSVVTWTRTASLGEIFVLILGRLLPRNRACWSSLFDLSDSTPRIMDVDTATPPTSRVGGHSGTSTLEDGSLLIKPTLAHGVSFCQFLASDPAFAPSKPYISKPYEDRGTSTMHRLSKGEKDKYLSSQLGRYREIVCVLATMMHSTASENLFHRPLKPNILEIKLGTTSYDSGASEMEKTRMLQTTKATTSFEAGVRRLMRFQVKQRATIGVGQFCSSKFVSVCVILGL